MEAGGAIIQGHLTLCSELEEKEGRVKGRDREERGKERRQKREMKRGGRKGGEKRKGKSEKKKKRREWKRRKRKEREEKGRETIRRIYKHELFSPLLQMVGLYTPLITSIHYFM